MVIHRCRFLFKASDLKNLRQILCCKVKYLAVPIPGYGDWWIVMCRHSPGIYCNMSGCFPDKSIWCLIGHVCQESKVI